MSINVELDTIVSGYNLNSINVNFERIGTALEEAFNKNGGANNQLSSDIDLNGFNLLNVNRVKSGVLEIDGVVITPSGLNAVDLQYKGAWSLTTEIDKNNVYTNNGSSYVARIKHTATAETEPEVGGEWDTYWYILSSKGDTGATGATGSGSGDLIASNNLSDVANVATARTNLDVPSNAQFNTLDGEALKDTDVGTGANQIVQLDAQAKLPAVDASNLTNLSGAGVVKWISPKETNIFASEQTKLPVQVGDPITRAVDTVGNRIVAIGNCNNTVINGVNSNVGLNIVLKQDGTVVDSQTYNIDVGETRDSAFYLEYTPTSSNSFDYTVEFQTPNNDSRLFIGSWFVLKEIS